MNAGTTKILAVAVIAVLVVGAVAGIIIAQNNNKEKDKYANWNEVLEEAKEAASDTVAAASSTASVAAGRTVSAGLLQGCQISRTAARTTITASMAIRVFLFFMMSILSV